MRRRRALVLVSLALACGGLAASQVRAREQALEAQVGRLVPVVVARADVQPGARLAPRLLATRQVPERFAPADALAAPEEVAGQRAAAAIAAGSYVTAGALTGEQADEEAGPPLRAGERALDLTVGGGSELPALAGQAVRVDVLVTTESRSFVALENAELLAARAGEVDAEHAGPTTLATLRVSQRQAVYLTAAQSFAREIRVLARPPRDRRRGGALAVSEADL
jgi:pilus assembly protein CpaB